MDRQMSLELKADLVANVLAIHDQVLAMGARRKIAAESSGIEAIQLPEVVPESPSRLANDSLPPAHRQHGPQVPSLPAVLLRVLRLLQQQVMPEDTVQIPDGVVQLPESIDVLA